MATEVVDVPEQSRYEIRLDERTVGFAAYQKAGRLIVFTHTEVDSDMEGQGIGGRLVQGALDDVRRQDIPVLPVCPFVETWIARHPDYRDLDYRRPPSSVTD